jgi:carboxyl-terminal processing protease
MNKRFYIYLPIILSLTLALGLILGSQFIPSASFKKGFFGIQRPAYNKVADIMRYIEQAYVDSVSFIDLERKAIDGLLQSLDPHSVYIPAEDFAAANDALKGHFDGIGVQFRLVRDSITVIYVIPGGPSEKAGLLGGDRIVEIDGETVAGVGIKEDEAMKKLKGPSKSKVTAGIYRKGHDNLIPKTITRGVIPTYSIDIAFLARNNVGYIKLGRFSGTTAREFSEALQTLRAKGMNNLILDLRGNGGGLLEAAVDLADELLPENKLIVYTEGYHREKMSYYSSKRGNFETGGVAILIDEFSASASEILAGAVQDHDRGVIVGRRSFGKGLVQEQLPLPDKSAIRLTISRYHTPSGRCIQRQYSGSSDEYYAEFYKQFMGDEAFQDSISMADTVRFITAEGKVVYGGGGILPDIFVPASEEFSSVFFKQIRMKGLLNNFGFDYADRHRKQLLAYRTADNFVKNYNLPDAVYDEFIRLVTQSGIRPKDEDMSGAELLIKTYLKGHIGRNIFSEAAYYPVVLNRDLMFLKALEALDKRAK